ncbi:aminophospholipid transporter, putative [Plasmodium vivax]|uniref:Aminophospholipid transporter, putative n=1 Tax=Plasmodium vivax TaxID=5855 RepID=A0A1G4H1X2_PLAVI|nr:aminophospholipid transporter, putative [Plasmodium vivax]
MHLNIKDIAMNMQREEKKKKKKKKKKFLNKLKSFFHILRTKFWNVGRCKRNRRVSILYYNDDEYISENKSNIIVRVFLSPVWSFLRNKTKATIGRLLKWGGFFYIWENAALFLPFQNGRNRKKTKDLEEEQNQAILRKLDRCVFLYPITDNLSNKHMIQICKNYLTNMLFYVHNWGSTNGEVNYKECKEIAKMKKLFIHKVNNLKAFNAENNLYISDDSLINKIMVRDSRATHHHYHRNEMKEASNFCKIRKYEQECVKTCYIPNGNPLRSSNNGEYICMHYKNRHQLIFRVIINRLGTFYFFVFFTSFLLQQMYHFRTNNYTYFALSFFVLFFFSSLKDLHTIAQRIGTERGVNAKMCRRVTPVGLVNVPCAEVKVGDVLYLEENEESPADMVLLKCSHDDVYVCSKNLDGKTDLKMRKSLLLTSYLPNIYDMFRLKIKVMIEKPHKRLDKMNGLFILSNYHSFVKSMYSDLACLQNTFFKSATGKFHHASEVFNYLIEDTYIEKAYKCVDFLIRRSAVPFGEPSVGGAFTSPPPEGSTTTPAGGIATNGKATHLDRTPSNDFVNRGAEPQDTHFENYISKFHSQSSSPIVGDESEENYKEQIGTENVIWCGSKIVRGKVYGLVAYAGADKKTSILVSRAKNISEGECKAKWRALQMWLFLVLSVCLYLCLQEERPLGTSPLISFVRYFLLLLPYTPYVNNMYAYLMSKISFYMLRKRKAIPKFSLLNFDIVDRISSTSFLLCDKEEVVSGEGLKLRGVHFLLGELEDKSGGRSGGRNGERCGGRNGDRSGGRIGDGSDDRKGNLPYWRCLLQALLNLVDFNPYLCAPPTEGPQKNGALLKNIDRYGLPLGGRNKGDKTDKLYRTIISDILNYTTDKSNKIFLTLLCMLFCNVAMVSGRGVKKKNEKERTLHSKWDSIYSPCLEESIFINFVKSCGMDVFRKDDSKIAVGILTPTITHNKKGKNETHSVGKNSRDKGREKNVCNGSNERSSERRGKKKKKKKNYEQVRQKCWNFKNSLQNGGIFKMSNVAEKVDRGEVKCERFHVGNNEWEERPGGSGDSGSGRRGGLSDEFSGGYNSGCGKGRAARNGRRERCRPGSGDQKGKNKRVKTYNFDMIDALSLDCNGQVICTLISYNEKIFYLVKGPGEKIANMLSCERGKKKLRSISRPFCAKGFRVVVFACREVAQNELDEYKRVSSEQGKKLFFKNVFASNVDVLAIATLKDGINANAKKCMDLFKRAKIKTWILSGEKKDSVIATSTSLQLLNERNYVCHLSRRRLTRMVRSRMGTLHTLQSSPLSGIYTSCDFHLGAPSPSGGLTLRRGTLPMCNICNADYGRCDHNEYLMQTNRSSHKLVLPRPDAIHEMCASNGRVNTGEVDNNQTANCFGAELEPTGQTCGDTNSVFFHPPVGTVQPKRAAKKISPREDGALSNALSEMLHQFSCPFGEAEKKGKLEGGSVQFGRESPADKQNEQHLDRTSDTQRNPRKVPPLQNCVYIVKGDIIDYYLKHGKREFMRALTLSRCALFYDCNSIQKGKIARCLRSAADGKHGGGLICSVGNHAKDLNMFNEADIAIRVNKHSGTNVSNLYADMEVQSFEDLSCIFFLYGYRISENVHSLVVASYYRGFTFLFLQFFFSYFFASWLSILSSICLLTFFAFLFIITFVTIATTQNDDAWVGHSGGANYHLLRRNALRRGDLQGRLFSLKWLCAAMWVALYQAFVLFMRGYCADYGWGGLPSCANPLGRLPTLQDHRYLLGVHNEMYVFPPLFITHLLHSLLFLPAAKRNSYFLLLAALFILFLIAHKMVLSALHHSHLAYFFKFDFAFFAYTAVTLGIVNVPIVIYYVFLKCTAWGAKSAVRHMKRSFESLCSGAHQIVHIGSVSSSLDAVPSFCE